MGTAIAPAERQGGASVTIFSTLRGPAGDSGGETAPASPGQRILVDVNHPAQVHLFRHAIAELEAQGHETFVTSRHKEVTVDLLDAYDIEHNPLTTRGGSLPSLVAELLAREVRLLGVARTFEPDVIVSRLSPAAAHVSAIVGCPFVAISDTHIDSSAIRRVYQSVTFPFVDAVCAPESFDLPIEADKRRHLDFQELAYLHPRYFQPDGDVLRAAGVEPDEPYFVVRLAGWDAYHDVGHAGLSPQDARKLVDVLSDHGTVYVSAEGDLPPDLAAHELPTPPEAAHHVLAFADLYVGDSGTMSSEAAMLGTPAIRTNSMVGEDDEGMFKALEHRYGLLRSFADSEEAIAAVADLVADGIDHATYRERRNRLLDEQPDVTLEIVDAVLDAAGGDETQSPAGDA